MSRSILIDGNNLAMASFFANAKLVSPTGVHTGAVFGMLRSIMTIIERFIPDMTTEKASLIVAWDCPRHESWRRKHYPDYKVSRDTPTPEQQARNELYYNQLPVLRRALTSLGIHQISAPEMEADDIAGILARSYEQGGMPLILVSGDKDWLQLVGQRVVVWQNTKKRLVHLGNFEEITEARDPEEYLKMLAIIGDDGDDVPGAQGIGCVYALKYLRGELNRDGKRYAKIVEWINDLSGCARSALLVDLRNPPATPFHFDIVGGAYDETAFLAICQELGFNSITHEFAKATSLFKRLW